jgi:DNA-directed RNA polymerase specialized sigma24 family protein
VSESSPQNPTKLLVRWSNGDRGALEALVPLVYDELRRVARYYLKQEKQNHMLSSTALVHEAYLRLVNQLPGRTGRISSPWPRR